MARGIPLKWPINAENSFLHGECDAYPGLFSKNKSNLSSTEGIEAPPTRKQNVTYYGETAVHDSQ